MHEKWKEKSTAGPSYLVELAVFLVNRQLEVVFATNHSTFTLEKEGLKGGDEIPAYKLYAIDNIGYVHLDLH